MCTSLLQKAMRTFFLLRRIRGKYTLEKEGLPYQTLAASLLHKYASS